MSSRKISRRRRVFIGVATMSLLALPAQRSVATTYYAAPSLGGEGVPVAGDGNNDGLSPNRPFRICDFWEREPQAGDVLVLLDGTYLGADNMVVPPCDLDLIGTPDRWIRVVAQHDGRVLIDGDADGDGIGDMPTCGLGTFSGDPVDADGDGQWDRDSTKRYVSVEGINVCRSSGNCVKLQAVDHVRIYRVCAWDAPPSGNSIVFVSTYADYNLFEDCAGWGTGRKIFKAYGYSAPGVESHHNTFRRCFGRWEYTLRTDPKMTFSYQYYSSHTLLENCIGTWDEQPGTNTSQDYGIFAHDRGSVGMNRILGCIAYVKASQNCTALNQLLLAGLTNDYEVKDCFAYVDNDHPRAPLINTFCTTGDGGVNTVDHITSVGGRGVMSRGLDPVKSDVFVCDALDRDEDGEPQDDNNVCALMGADGATHVYFFANDENWESIDCDTIPLNIISPLAVPLGDPDCPHRVEDRFRTGPDALGVDPLLDTQGRSFVVAHTSPMLRGQGTGGSDLGANIWFRYVDGELTDELLWPWPMNQRILEATTAYHDEDPDVHPPPVDVTREVFELGGGSIPGDFDGDSDVDLADFAAFTACFSGAGLPAPANCEAADFDWDGDVDLGDFAYFQRVAASF